jgi:uncharacterized protein
VSWSGMRGISSIPTYVVMQPTTLCNLDCTYCYLPFRAQDQRMTLAVAESTAVCVNAWAGQRAAVDDESAGGQRQRFSVVWHGGEPLAAGRDGLAELMAPFVGVDHHIQTNATLIDDAWCEFFTTNGVRMSVSVDGPPELNGERVNRGGAPAYKKIIRGIETLRRHAVPFSALCVVSKPRPGLAAELYSYFLDLGCDVLGINIEEQEGVNARTNDFPAELVQGFWGELVGAWRRDPRIHVREIEWTLRYAGAVLDGYADAILPRQLDPIPTIAADGRVFLLSPELAGFNDPHYGDFSSGNVLEASLSSILTRAATSARWVPEYLAGVEACRTGCPYFGFCGGAHAANRYFEHGRFDGTETNHCRNSKIRLLEGVLDHAGAQ